jgi:hypothetical protein
LPDDSRTCELSNGDRRAHVFERTGDVLQGHSFEEFKAALVYRSDENVAGLWNCHLDQTIFLLPLTPT